MESITSEVSTLLNIDYDSAQLLLQANRWDKERLIDAFFGDPEKVFLETGLDKYVRADIESKLKIDSKNEAVTSSATSKPSPSKSAETFVCRICCDDMAGDEALSLGCLHKFCRVCYTEYLRNQVLDGPSCIRAHCPEHKCAQSVPRSFFTTLLEGPIAERYGMFVMRNYIETSKTMRYCPAPGCVKVAIGSGVTKVNCECANPFCFRCGEEAHDPCSCAQLAEWALKCMNESETTNWILANTKKCPKCNTRIEKNQGCNHMNCKLCKHEFCWICMGSWADHGQVRSCSNRDIVKNKLFCYDIR
jgi:ariadne-1